MLDLAKVVIDYPKGKKDIFFFDTGGFSIVHRAKNETVKAKGNFNLDLTVSGNRAKIQKVSVEKLQ